MGNSKSKKVKKPELYDLYQQIKKMVHSESVTERLISHYKEKYINRDLVWIYKKIIYDLKRERN